MVTQQRGTRRHPRATVPLQASLLFKDAPEMTIRARDLAEEGASFRTAQEVEMGTPVLLRLEVPGEPSAIECKGRVCWNRLDSKDLHRFGVRFLDLSDLERLRLRRAVRAERPTAREATPLVPLASPGVA
jgi:Tfp pilus assembly protein PilZ